MSEQDGSQTVETQQNESAAISDAFEAFGIKPPTEQSDAADSQADASNGEESEPPAKAEQQTEQKPGLRVKYNKEEVEIPEDQVTEYVQKGLALDKERERRSEYEKALDRAAKLQGFKDHADLIANLDRIEQEREQQQKDQFDSLRQQVIDDLVANGVDEQAAREYAENNPLVKQAREALQEKERLQSEQQTVKQQQETAAKWAQLYETFPDLVESSKVFNDGGKPDWYNAEMESMIAQGYHPLHAYKLAHMDKIQQQTTKQTEQKLIKQQQLGLRSQVEADAPGQIEPEVSDELRSAFSMFGIDPKRAQKYAKK